MSKPMIQEHNSETDQVIEREMNAEELAKWEEDQAVANAREAELEAQSIAKAALLDRLNITEAEAKLLLS